MSVPEPSPTQEHKGIAQPQAHYAERLLSAVGGRERFEQGFAGRAFSPQRLAHSTIAAAAASWAAGVDALAKAGLPPEAIAAWEARFLRLWLAYQAAGARTMNWMITGPARFPVERNRKRMEAEHKRGVEYLAHAEGAAEYARRHARSVAKAALSAEAATVDHAEKPFPGGRLVRNVPLDRVQLIFDGKPDADIIAELKSRAFRWSPRESAWQRQLTRNGVWAAEAVVARITRSESA